MTLCFFFLFLLEGSVSNRSLANLEPTYHLTEDKPVLGDQGLGYPYDAVLHQGKLYVADMYSSIMVFEPDRLIRVFGDQGPGPKEMAHPPVRLDFVDDQIHAIEMYGWHYAVFSVNGEMLQKHKMSRNWVKSKSHAFREFTWREAKATGYRFIHDSTNCPVSYIDEYSHKNYHLSDGFVAEFKENLLVVKRSGFVEIYDHDCQLKDAFPLPVEPFKQPLKDDRLGNMIAKQVSSLQGMNTYQYGVPIISMSIDDDRLWFLVSREELESDMRRPQETWLFCSDLNTGEIIFKSPLETPAEKIRISEGYLILIATEDVEIKAWPLARINSLLN